MSTLKYLIVIEKAKTNYAAYAPDVPGCISTGKTIEETKANIKEALAYHLAEMKEDGEPIPEPETIADYLELETPASISDEVREYTFKHYIAPARREGKRSVTVKVAEVHKALGFRNRKPLVRAALTSQVFRDKYHVQPISKRDTEVSTATTLSFEL